MQKKHWYFILGSSLIAFILGVSLVIPVFQRHTSVETMGVTSQQNQESIIAIGDPSPEPSGGTIDGDMVYWENNYARLEVTPHTSNGIITQTQYASITWKYPDNNIDITFRFDEPLSGKKDIWLWQNISHNVKVYDYGDKAHNFTLENISDFQVLSEQTYVDFGDNSSLHYAQVNTNTYKNMEWVNDTFIIGFDSYEWLNPNHTSANLTYHSYGVISFHNEIQHWFDWIKKTHLFQHTTHDDKHYYYLTNIPAKQNHSYKVKWQYDIPIHSSGKWELITKLSSETINEALSSGHYVMLDPWWDSSWNYAKLITVDSSKVNGSSDLTNFPILVRIDADSDIGAHCQPDLDDIAFIAIDNATQWNHELGSYSFNGNALTASIWLNVTTLSHNTDTKFWLYYGNADASSQEDATNVWDSNCLGVYHLDGDVDDSTSNYKNLTNHGATLQTDGISGGCYNFTSSESDYADLAVIGDISTLTQITMEAWARPSKLDGTTLNAGIQIGRYVVGTDADCDVIWWVVRRNNGVFLSSIGTPYPYNRLVTSSTGQVFENHLWTYAVMTIDENVGTDGKLWSYINGTFDVDCDVATGDNGNPIDFSELTNDELNVGRDHRPSANYYFDGSFDEIRISDIVRSTDWIKTTYNTTMYPSTFLSFGDAQGKTGFVVTFSGETPSNNNYNISVNPTLNITVNDKEGNVTTCDWYTSTDGNSWTHRQQNNSVQANSSISHIFTGATEYQTTYYWKVTANDTHDNITSSTYYFETTPYRTLSFNDTYPNERWITNKHNMTYENGWENFTHTAGSGPDVVFYDSFEDTGIDTDVTTSGNWSDGTGDYKWRGGDCNTPSSSTGCTACEDGSRIIYTEASSRYSKNYYLESSEFIGGSNITVEFWYHMYGTAMGTLKIQIWDGSVWDDLWSLSGQQQTAGANPFRKGVAGSDNGNSYPYTGTTKIRIYGLTGTTYTSDMCIDKVYINKTNVGVSDAWIQSKEIHKPSGCTWDKFYADVNDTGHCSFALSDNSTHYNISSGLTGNGDDISSVTNNSLYIFGNFSDASVSMGSWNITWTGGVANNAPTMDSFNIDTETGANAGWDLDNNDAQMDWATSDTDADPVTVYITFNKGSTARLPTIGDYDYHVQQNDASNKDCNWEGGTWSDYNGAVYVRIRAHDGTVYSNTQINDTLANGIDGTNPTSSVNTITPYIRDENFNIEATANDITSGLDYIDMEYRFSSDNNSWGSWVAMARDTVEGDGWVWGLAGILGNGRGYYEFRCNATDNAGNTESLPGSADAIFRYISWGAIDDTINGVFSNTSTWHILDDTINGSFSNTTAWYIVDNTINGTFGNFTDYWHTIDDTINGSFSNTTAWYIVDNSINGSFTNTTAWYIVDNTINGVFSNTSTWYIIDNSINGSFSNSSTWKIVDDTINGVFSNTSTWHILDDTINGSFSNTTAWYIVDNTINGTFGNFTDYWHTIDDTINGSFSNTTAWYIVDNSINGSFTNTTAWYIVDNTINGVFSNTSTWYIIDNSINGSFSNSSTWKIVDDTINGVFSNTSTWHILDDTINGSFSNTTAWYIVDNTINGTFGNFTDYWHTIDDTINGSFSNTTAWYIVDNSINGSFTNTTAWYIVDNTINGVFSNTSTWYIIDNSINGSFSNSSTWKIVDDTINGVFSNTSTWHILDDTINGSFSNTTAWYIVDNTINGTFGNFTDYWHTIDDTINGSFSNTTAWYIVDNSINGSFTNTTAWYIVDNTINGVFSNTSTWYIIDNSINGSFSNSSTWKIVDDTINGVFSNTSTWHILDDTINGSFSNTTAWYIVDNTINGTFGNFTDYWHTIDDTINGSFSNTTAWYIVDNSINGSFTNTTAWYIVDNTINGTFGNFTDYWHTIDDTINGVFYNVSSFSITDIFPANNSYDIHLQPTTFFTLESRANRSMNYTIYIGTNASNISTLLATGNSVNNGTYPHLYYSAIDYSTKYYWRLSVNDGVIFRNRTLNFMTGMGDKLIVIDNTNYGLLSIFGVLGLFGLVFSLKKAKSIKKRKKSAKRKR